MQNQERLSMPSLIKIDEFKKDHAAIVHGKNVDRPTSLLIVCFGISHLECVLLLTFYSQYLGINPRLHILYI
jgi:hypothetical protein